MISVLMPARDASRYVELAARSTLASLHADDELIVVDDGSTDATGALLAGMRRSDRRLRVISHATGVGVAASLDEALEAARGDLVARMDADDVCFRRRFVQQVRELAEADIHFSSVVKIDGRGRPLGLTPPFPVSAAAAGALLTIGNFFVHPTMLGRRSVLLSLGGWPVEQVEDYGLWVHAVAEGRRITAGALPTVSFRRHREQTSRTWRVEEPGPRFLSHFRSLLPGDLGDDPDLALELARSARDRVRRTPAARQAWRRLRAALSAVRLPAIDAAHLRVRMAAVDRSLRP